MARYLSVLVCGLTRLPGSSFVPIHTCSLMGYSIQVVPDKGLLYIALAGSISGPVINQAIESLREHPSYQPTHAQLWDARGVTELDVDWPDMITMIHLVGNQARQESGLLGRLAVVAPRFIDNTFARAVLARTRWCHREKKVFWWMAPAQQWIGVTQHTESDRATL